MIFCFSTKQIAKNALQIPNKTNDATDLKDVYSINGSV